MTQQDIAAFERGRRFWTREDMIDKLDDLRKDAEKLAIQLDDNNWGDVASALRAAVRAAKRIK